MTVVIAVNWLTEVVVIADTRVSWENNLYPPQDILRKLYTFGDSHKSVVLGFSGDLQTAKTVLTFLIKRKLRRYKRPLVLRQFKDDMQRWIEEVATKELDAQQKSNLQLMLCGIEPLRHPPLVRDRQIVGYTPFLEPHIYTYSITSAGKVHVKKSPSFAIIGSGAVMKNNIGAKAFETIEFGFRQPNLHWARAFLIGHIIASIVQEDEAVSASVGGPFQVIRITANGLETQYVWLPNNEFKNVQVTVKGSQTIIYNPDLEQRYVLYPVWDYPNSM